LLEVRAAVPLMALIDEFHCLVTDDAGLAEIASELKAVWERQRSGRPTAASDGRAAPGVRRAGLVWTKAISCTHSAALRRYLNRWV